MQHSKTTVQSPNVVSMPGQRRRLWVNIETVLIEWHLFRKVYNRPGDRLMLGQRRRRSPRYEPAMGCNAGPTLNRNLVGGLHPLYQVHRKQVLNVCWPAPAMVWVGWKRKARDKVKK